MQIPINKIEEAALEIMRRAAIEIPDDYKQGILELRKTETGKLPRFVIHAMVENWEAADQDRRPMCADTGLPRYYVKVGNHASVESGFVAIERALRHATAEGTVSIPLRPNRVHPLWRTDHNNNVGLNAPEVEWSFEPDADWIDITTVHKGGLFGTDYRMLFPGDGIDGIKRFVLDTLIAFGKRGLACQPAIVGIGLGGSKDTCMQLGKQAACLRTVGDRNPDPRVAELELELMKLGNAIGMGAMGFVGSAWWSIAISNAATRIPAACRSACIRSACRRAAPPRASTPTAASNIEPIRNGSPLSAPGDGRMVSKDDDIKVFHLDLPARTEDIARLELGSAVYLNGLVTAREGVYKKVLDEGLAPPVDLRALSNVNFHCSPAAAPDGQGGYRVGAVTATASFRFSKWIPRWLEETGCRILIGKGGMPADDYKRVLAPGGAIYLTTVGYGTGALLGRGIKRVREVHWLDELGIAQAMWLFDVENFGPFIVESDLAGNSLFAQHAETINAGIERLYAGLKPPALHRYGETDDRKDEVM